MKLFRPLLAAMAVAAVFTMVIADADARPRVSAGLARLEDLFGAAPDRDRAERRRADQPHDDAAGRARHDADRRATAGGAAGRHCSAVAAACSAGLPPACSAPA